jgi:hypothetical protein
MFRTFVVVVLGFLGFLVVTYVVVVFGTILVWEVMSVHDQDGGGAMALGLVIGPAVAIVGGVIGAIVTYLWYAKRQLTQPPQGPAESRRDTKRFAVLAGAVAGGFVGNYISQIGFWLASPIQFDSYWKVWAISWLPNLLTLLGAIGGGLGVRRWMRGK